MRQKDGAKAMGAIEKLQRDCGYCRQPITLKWRMGQCPEKACVPGR